MMHYLKRTKGYMLTYRKSKGLEIIGYSNSDFIYLLAGGAISWKSIKQTLIAPSTMAVEVVDGIERPLEIYYDNNSAVLYSNNNRSFAKSKFINIKVQNKQITIEHIAISFMLAYPLTKGLIPKVFHEHTAHMGVIP
ncbi:hypothetical protein CR513_06922, partial [Mucuna pruriens]